MLKALWSAFIDGFAPVSLAQWTPPNLASHPAAEEHDAYDDADDDPGERRHPRDPDPVCARCGTCEAVSPSMLCSGCYGADCDGFCADDA